MKEEFIYALEITLNHGPFISFIYLNKDMLKQVIDTYCDIYKDGSKGRFSYRVLKINKKYERKIKHGYEIPNDVEYKLVEDL